MERILIYGFKPYKKYKKNISEAVVKRIKLDRGLKLKKAILPALFAFIHIPKNYNLKKATKVSQELIRNISP